MPGLRRELDPEATATAPSAAKQTPPRAPRLLVQEKDGDPGEETAENRAVPSPCAACRTSPSKKTPPRAPPLAQDQVTIHGCTGDKTGDNRAAPSPCDSPPPPRALGQPASTTSTLYQVTDGAPAPQLTYAPVAARTDRRKLVTRITAGPVEKTVVKKPATYPCVALAPPSRPCPAQARYATAPASYAPVPFEWPIPYRGIFPRPYAPAPAAVFPGAMPSHQLPRTAPEVALARTQPQGSAGFKRKGEVPVDSEIQERPLRTSDEPVKNSVERDILDSMKAFGSHNPLEMDTIRFALVAIPRGPELFLQCEKCPDDQSARGATCIHACSGLVGESSISSVKAFGLKCPELGSVKSDPWNTIWEQKPLILRDSDIVRAAQMRGTAVNVVQTITDILKNHSGPIAYFRIDSCQLDIGNRDKLVEDWFDLLRKKQIKEVVLVNCSWPVDMFDFSVANLDCQSLERVSLSFMKLSDIFLKHACNLVVINLCGCALTATDLYALLYECRNLQVLSIGMYEGDVIRINSKSLEVLKIWHCTVRKVAVNNALKLQRVLVVSGPNKASMKVGIWIEDAPLLSAVSFNLSSQSVAICDLTLKTDNAPLHSMRTLVLHLSFKAEKEKKTLLKFMESCKTLKELIIWRNDERYQYEFLDAMLDDWSAQLKDVYCLKYHFELFMIQDCKGGEAELAVSSAILEHSSCLKQLILEGDIFKDATMLIQTKSKLEKATRSSKSAILTVKAGLSDCHKQTASFLEEV